MDNPVDKPGSRFSGDVLKLVLGATLAQGLMVLVSPILTRLYSPDDFGLYSIFVAISGIISAVSCLRYEMSIVLPTKDEEAANLMGVSFFVASLVSLLTVPVVWLGGPFILSILKIPRIGPYLWLIPPITFFGGVTLGHPALNNWNTRNKKFRRTASIQVINALIVMGVQVSAGLIGWATGGSLIAGVFIGSLISTTILGWLIWRENGDLFKRNINIKDMLAGMKRYRKFPLYDAVSTLMNVISWQLPSFLLSIFFSPAVVGFYALGSRVLRAPMDFIGNAIAQVFFQRSAEARTKGNLASVVENVFEYLVILGLFPMLLLSVIGRDLFIIIFGSQWAEAGVYSQILSLWMFAWFISSPLSTLFRVLERQEISLILNIAIFLTRFISLFIGGWFGNARLALVLFSISGVLLYGYMGFSIVFVSGVSKSKVARTLLKYLALFLPCGLLLLFLQYLMVSPLFIVLASLGIAGLYYLYILRSNPQLYGLLKGLRSRIL